jgi:hypothetical protein
MAPLGSTILTPSKDGVFCLADDQLCTFAEASSAALASVTWNVAP